MESFNRVFMSFDLDSPPLNPDFEEFGFTYSNFILNTQILFWALNGWFVMAGLTTLLLKLFTVKNKATKALSWIH
jgi:hypothetical protein